MIRPSSVLFDKNKESWLAVEENVIRIFTSKNSVVQYRIENNEKPINVLHRYSDGSLEPVIFWSNQPKTEETDRPLMDLIEEQYYSEFDDINDYEEDIDFYDLCSGSANDSNPNAEKSEEE
jgi:hypothetical protein